MFLSKSTRVSRTAELPDHVYELSCCDCSFETTVKGDAFDIYDVIDDHQEDHEESALRHFVNFEAAGLTDAPTGIDDGQTAD